MAVYIQIPENPNCAAVEGHVFQCRSSARTVRRVRVELAGVEEWCAITGLEEGGRVCPARACLIEDSGEGECFLVVGGSWGLRLARGAADEWDVEDGAQWGEAFLILGGDGADLELEEEKGPQMNTDEHR